MAGRGVDILLGGNPNGLVDEKLRKKGLTRDTVPPELLSQFESEAKAICEKNKEIVVEAGGLHIIGTERHEARRIDNQLRGRAGRQGDPGSSRFYVSLEDDIMRRFGGSGIANIMTKLGIDEETPIEHGLVSKAIENAQTKVEAHNFDIRKHVVQYDDVMNKQREVIYKRRQIILSEDDLKSYAIDMIKSSVSSIVDLYINPNDYKENWNIEELSDFTSSIFAKDLFKSPSVKKIVENERARSSELKEALTAEALTLYDIREKELSPEILRKLEKLVMLNVIDNRWREHLLEMDYLKEGIGLRAYGQKDPIVEFKHEAYNLFKDLIEEIKVDTVRLLFNAKVVVRSPESKDDMESMHEERAKELALKNVRALGPSDVISNISSENSSKSARPEPIRVQKVGRNDPCPCGSGKKYKKCCGRQ